MNIIYMFFYLLPMMLIFVILYLIISMIRKKKRGIRFSIISIILISVILILYYYPKDKIMKDYNFNYIYIDSGNMPRVTIINQEEINKILRIINKHTFIRSAVRTVEDERFPGNELITISMDEHGKIFHLYILKEHTEKNVLQVNMQMYNVKDKDGISKEMINLLEEFDD